MMLATALGCPGLLEAVVGRGLAPAAAQVLSTESLEAGRLYQQSRQLFQEGKYVEAQALAEQALAIRERLLAPNHLDLAESLSLLGNILSDQDALPRAESLFERALAIRQEVLGPEHPDVAKSLNSLAILHRKRGQYQQSELLYERALAIWEKSLGLEHPYVATTLNNLANLYSYLGNYQKAESLHKRALAIREKILGLEHPDVAATVNDLASLYTELGNYRKAESLHKRAQAIWEKALGLEHPKVAITLNNLASLYAELGNYREAESLFKRALAIRQQVFSPEHPLLASVLDNLATLYTKQGRYGEAEPLFERALTIMQKSAQSKDPTLALILNDMAVMYTDQGRWREAEPLHRRALALQERLLGPEHPEVAKSLHNLGSLLVDLGKYQEAEPLFEHALAIMQKVLGPEHPLLAESLQKFAVLRLGQSRLAEAQALLRRQLDIQEPLLALNLTAADETSKRNFLANFADGVDLTVSVHLQHAPTDSQAARLALNAVLQRKGRVLDELAGDLTWMRNRYVPGMKDRLDQLSQARSALAALIFRWPQQEQPGSYRTQLAALEQQNRQLESDLAAGARSREPRRPVTVEAVQRLLPAGTALMELVRYRPFDLKADRKANRFGPERYAAYLLTAGSSEVRGVDLGEAAAIDRMVLDLRTLLADKDTPIVAGRVLARRLDTLLMQPVRARLGVTRTLWIAPDAQLNLLPFGTLVDEQGRYLLERSELVYLTSGRDLVRLADLPTRSRQAPLLIAAPDFDNAQTSPGTDQQRSGDFPLTGELSELRVAGGKLPGAAKEAAALLSLLPGMRSLTGPDATENALKAVHGPPLLHLATHGFFLKDTGGGENSLLRSGLALAGFNVRTSGAEDGVFTALEAAGLDLDGTELVVLSACDTGLGDVVNGEGVYGLRRALSIAGARSQVFSLWKIGDEATAELMVAYYRQLLKGHGRGEALRRAQLGLLRSAGRSHPHWWAAFVPIGDRQPLTFARVSPSQTESRKSRPLP